MMLTADASADPEPPYLRWRVVDASGNAQPDTVVAVQGPREGAVDDDTLWRGAAVTTVRDFTGQSDYVGADLDPGVGVFLVKQLPDDANPASVHDVVAAEHYRVRPAAAPVGFAVGEDAGWARLGSSAEAVPDADVQKVALDAVSASEAGTDALALAPDISPLAIILEDCGNTAACAGLRITTNVVGGGPATVSSWDLKAVRNNAAVDEYLFTSGTTRTVARNVGGSTNTVYTLSATADPEIQKWYTTSFSCQVGSPSGTNNTTSVNNNNRQVTFGRGSGGTPTNRYAYCTFTQTYSAMRLVMTKVGDRTGTGLTSGAPLNGVTFTARVSSSSGSGGVPTGAALGTCVTGSTGPAGVCEILIPKSSAYANGIWIEETAWPAGWSPIGSLGTGDYQSTKTVTPYRFRVTTDTSSGVTTINVPADRNLQSPPVNLPNTSVSGPWVDVRDNPGFPTACGLSIAMVFDTSTSINSTEMTAFKEAAQGFVGADGLGGTPSSVTMFRFDTRAGTLNNGDSFQLATAGAAGDSSGIGGSGYLGAQNTIANGLPGSGNGFTNWDEALQLVKGTDNYDMVLFLTDGDPTTYGTGGTTNTNVQFRMVEQAVMSANAVKASTGPAGAKTKIVGIGVGLSTNSDLNLQAITGKVSGDDYFLAANFDTLKEKLNEIAMKNCAGTLTVIKQIQNPDGTVKTENAAGWSITATGDVVNGSPATKVTTSSGTNFPLTFNDLNTHTVAVDETPQAGYTYVGANCTNAAGEVTKTTNGFTVPLKSGLITSCTLINREEPKAADATWKKVDDQTPAVLLSGSEWTIVGPGFTAPNNVIVDCTSGSCSGMLDKDPVAGQFKLEGLAIGTYTVTETKAPSGHSGGNSFEIVVNSSNAGTTIDKGPFVNKRLTGTATWKKVSSADAQQLLGGSEWKLVGPGHPGPNGSTVVDCTGSPCNGADKDPVAGQFKIEGLAWGDYTLTETKAPFGYLLDQTPHAFTVTKDNVSAAIVVGTFKNVPITPPTVPLTGGLGSDQILLGGAGVVAAALLVGWLMWSRRRLIRTGASTGV